MEKVENKVMSQNKRCYNLNETTTSGYMGSNLRLLRHKIEELVPRLKFSNSFVVICAHLMQFKNDLSYNKP